MHHQLDQERFTALYHTLYDKIYRLCKGYFNGDSALAHDATQDVFMKVWQHAANFRQEASIATWIYRIAVNTCLLYIRKSGTQKEIKTGTLPDRTDPVYDDTTDVQLKKMYACIQQLEAGARLVILLVLEGVTYEEIAQIIGVSQDTLRVKIHRIKKTLTNCVQHDKF